MHILHTLSIVALIVLCWLLLDVAALAIIVIAREYSKVRSAGCALLRFGSTAILALPGVILAGMLVQNANLLPVQPMVYAIGATSSCALLNLCLRLE
jgi:hypothetical protein